MSWLSKLLGRDKESPEAAAQREQAQQRAAEWELAFSEGRLPSFVTERLDAAAKGRTPWVATMTPAELLLARSHGVRPIATVSGTCWFQYGYSWTEGHASGWQTALGRITNEAIAAGANAVVDVRMRTIRHRFGASMDFTLVGTAIRVEGLPPSPHPVIATVPALEFVRLLEMGIVPTGIAVGAQYEWIDGYNISGPQRYAFTNQHLADLSSFWESIRRSAHAELRANAKRLGNGLLAHVHLGDLIQQERDKQPPIYLGRHIVIGTVVETRKGDGVPHDIEMVVDMRDDLSPLVAATASRHNAYDGDNEREGAI